MEGHNMTLFQPYCVLYLPPSFGCSGLYILKLLVFTCISERQNVALHCTLIKGEAEICRSLEGFK